MFEEKQADLASIEFLPVHFWVKVGGGMALDDWLLENFHKIAGAWEDLKKPYKLTTLPSSIKLKHSVKDIVDLSQHNSQLILQDSQIIRLT